RYLVYLRREADGCVIGKRVSLARRAARWAPSTKRGRYAGKGDTDVEEQKPDEQAEAKKSTEAMQSSDQHKLRHIGKPGIESASGRDRSKGELPANFGTDEGPFDISEVA